MIEVDRIPTECRDLTSAQTTEGHQDQRNEKAALPCGVDRCRGAGRADDRDGFFVDLRPELRWMSFQRSAWLRAEYRTRCMWWTVRGERPPLPSRRPLSIALPYASLMSIGWSLERIVAPKVPPTFH
jgi:hypothetical protein